MAWDVRASAGFNLLLPATKHERIAPLEPDNVLAFARQPDQLIYGRGRRTDP